MSLFKSILAGQLETLLNGRHFMSHTKNGFWVVRKWQRKLISCQKKGNFVKYWRDLNWCIRLLVGFKHTISIFPSVPVERHFSHSWISHLLFIWTSNESLTNWTVIELSRNFAARKAVLDPWHCLVPEESQSPAFVNQAWHGPELNLLKVADVVDIQWHRVLFFGELAYLAVEFMGADFLYVLY